MEHESLPEPDKLRLLSQGQLVGDHSQWASTTTLSLQVVLTLC